MSEANEVIVPDFLKNKLFFNRFTVSYLADCVRLINKDFADDNKPMNTIILLTNFGLITCKPDSFDDFSDSLSSGYIRALLDNRNSIIDEMIQENPDLSVENISPAIALTDIEVKLYSSMGQSLKFAELLLFVDQICGISIGSIKQD